MVSASLANSAAASGQSQRQGESDLEQSQKQLRQKFAELGPLIQAQEPAALMKALQDEGHRRFSQLLSCGW